MLRPAKSTLPPPFASKVMLALGKSTRPVGEATWKVEPLSMSIAVLVKVLMMLCGAHTSVPPVTVVVPV